MSLLMFACKKTNTQTVKCFLRFQHLQICHRDQAGRNAVHYALENPDEEEAKNIVKTLMRQQPLLKGMGSYSKGNYITNVIRQGKSLLLEALIQEEIEPNYRSLEGLGPLHEAVRAHKTHKSKEKTLNVLIVLLNAGCQEEEKNNDGQTYMNYAREKGYLHDEDIDEILQEMVDTTPKATIETSPEQKQNELFSIESGEVNRENESQESDDSDTSQVFDDEVNHVEISAEMQKWAAETREEHCRVWRLIYPFYQKVQQIVEYYEGEMEVIGSFGSQLWIPSSDIDLLIVVPDGGQIDIFQDVLDCLYRNICQLKCHSSIRIIRTYKLPLIKLVLLPEYEKLEIQLFLSNKKNIASRYVAYMNEVIAFYPDVSVIYYVLRRILAVRRLHDHRVGGLKAYALFLLLYSMRSQYSYQYVSQFVEHFCYYYGFMFEYQASVGLEGEVEYHMNILDPLNRENNMGGKKTDVLQLQEVLKKVYWALNTGSRGSKLCYIVEVLRDL